MGTKVQHQMKTLRYKVFAIGGYMIKNGNSRILKLSMQMKRRDWFKGLWSSTETNELAFPCAFVILMTDLGLSLLSVIRTLTCNLNQYISELQKNISDLFFRSRKTP